MRWPLIATATLLLGYVPLCQAEEEALRQEACNALRRATAYFRQEVSTQGGYLWRYSEDLERREGEDRADDQTVWLEPPGTPAVGMAFLQAYWDTGDRCYLDAALAAGDCLIRGQLRSGGWDNSITFDPVRRRKYAYRVDRPKSNQSLRNTTTLDDNKTQSAVRLLVHLDITLNFENERLHEATLYALQALVDAQYPNGAWPQRFSAPPDPNAHPIRRASYPESWSRTFSKTQYGGYYTFNDSVIGDVVDVMVLAHSVYQDQRYLKAVERGGEFILLAQMPDPQPAWAQQYDLEMHPAWARKFEPPAVTGGESQGVIRTLCQIYRQTGQRRYLDAIPRAITYLRQSELPDGRLARFYELRTNRPLYFTRDYVLTYSDADMPTHYGFKTGNGLDALERAYQQALAWPRAELGPKPYRRPTPGVRASRELIAQVRAVIEALDDQGRWLQEGRLRDRGDDEPAERIIDCRTFIRNCRVLSQYLGTKSSS